MFLSMLLLIEDATAMAITKESKMVIRISILEVLCKK